MKKYGDVGVLLPKGRFMRRFISKWNYNYRSKPLAGSLLIILVWIWISAIQAEAATLKWRQVQHISRLESIEVQDVPGHILGIGQGTGLAFFPIGGIATFFYSFTSDYINGSGPHILYFVYTFTDGSTLATKNEGITTVEQEGKVFSFKGESTIIRGSGKFAPIQGRGTYMGKGFLLSAGDKIEWYLDFDLTYTLDPE